MPQLNITTNRWEKEFSSGQWDYLDFEPTERARSSIIGMYSQHYFPKGKILDIGCGLGTVVDFLNSSQKKKYLGLDISKEAIEKAQSKKVRFINVDFANFKSLAKFDIIIFNEVLYHMDEEMALDRAMHLLTKNGILIVSLYKMKNKRYDKEIRKVIGKKFKSIESIGITSIIKKQLVTWQVEALKRK